MKESKRREGREGRGRYGAAMPPENGGSVLGEEAWASPVRGG